MLRQPMKTLSLAALIGLAGISLPAAAGFDAADYVRLAQKAYAKGKLDKVRRHAERALDRTESPVLRGAAYSLICMADLNQELLESALASCQSAVDEQPDNWRSLTNRGVALMKAGQLTAALDDFERARTLGGEPDLLADNIATVRQRLAAK